MKKKNDSNSDENGKNPPNLGEDELKEMKARLEQEAERRKSASSGYFRVLVDGEQVAFFDSFKQNSQKFEFDREFAELIEVYSVENGRDTLLTTYLMGGDDEFAQSSMILGNGQKISFSFNESVCEIGYQETKLSRKLAVWWRKTIRENFSILRPATAAFGMILAVIVGIIIYFNLNTQAPQTVENTQENISPNSIENKQNIELPKEIVKPEVAQAVNNKKAITIENRSLIQPETVKPIEVKKAEANTVEPKAVEVKKAERKVEFEENTEIAEVKKFPIIENREDAIEGTTRSINESGKSLKNIKYIYIEVSGDDKFGRQIGEQLMDKFNANKRFLAVNNKEKADGMLKVSVRREHDNAKDEQTFITATVRLVNADGFVVFPSKKKVSAWRYVGNATKIPEKVVKDLTEVK